MENESKIEKAARSKAANLKVTERIRMEMHYRDEKQVVVYDSHDSDWDCEGLVPYDEANTPGNPGNPCIYA